MKPKLSTKDLMEFKFSAIDSDDEEKGVFKGYASVFDVADTYGDIVDPAAFNKTLRDQKGQVPMLWNHSVDEPIGVINLTPDAKGIKAEGHLNLDVPRANWVRSLMKQGAIRGLSIGFKTIKAVVDEKTNGRRLKEINLWEVSPLVFQACPGANVDSHSVKGAEGEEEQEECIGQCAGCKANEIAEEPEQSTPADDMTEPEKSHLVDLITLRRP